MDSSPSEQHSLWKRGRVLIKRADGSQQQIGCWTSSDGSEVLYDEGCSLGEGDSVVLPPTVIYKRQDESHKPQPAAVFPLELLWRTGRKVGRTIYAQLGSAPSYIDVLIGTMDTRELAAEAVYFHNAALDKKRRNQPAGREEPIDVEFDTISVKVLSTGVVSGARLQATIELNGQELWSLEPHRVAVGDTYTVRLGGVARGPLMKVS